MLFVICLGDWVNVKKQLIGSRWQALKLILKNFHNENMTAGKRISRRTFWAQLQVSSFIRWGIIEGQSKNNGIELKLCQLHPPIPPHVVLVYALLYAGPMRAIIDANGGLTLCWHVLVICAKILKMNCFSLFDRNVWTVWSAPKIKENWPQINTEKLFLKLEKRLSLFFIILLPKISEIFIENIMVEITKM